MNHTYTEIQKFRQWYAIFLYAFLFALGSWMFYNGFLTSYLQSGTIEVEVLVFSILIFGILIFLYSIRLVISLDQEGISIKFIPFVKEFHRWDQIEKIAIVEYPSSNKGIRWSENYGVVYSIRGNRGVHITFKNGEKYYVSSMEPEKLMEEIRLRLRK